MFNYTSSCSWVKKFGEHNGLDVLLDILKTCVSIGFTGKDALLRRIQHHCVRCIKAFMNNKVGFDVIVNYINTNNVITCTHVHVCVLYNH